MIRASYEYIESQLAPSLSFISRALGIGYSGLLLIGIGMIIRLGDFVVGGCCIAGAAVLFIISKIYNDSVVKTIQNIIENQPEKVVKISYEQEIKNLHDSFSRKEISENDFTKRKESLQNEMVREIRKYKPNYKLGDKL